MHRFEWAGEVGVEFHLPHGQWIELLRANGFEVERLIEVQAPAGAETHEFYAYVTAEWAREWPPRTSGSRARSLSAAPAPPLVLASTSPQRRSILTQLGVPFEVVAPDFDEIPGTSPLERAAGKARSVPTDERPVLGVDTEVLLRRRAARQARRRDGSRGDARGARGPHARGRVGPLPAHPAGEELHTEATLVRSAR